MLLAHSVFPMIAAELGKERDRGVGPLGHQLTEHPVHGLTEDRSLVVEVGGEQIAHAGVDGEPVGVELPDQLIGSVLRIERGLQHPQRVAIV